MASSGAQDSNDQPASELLRRIIQENDQLTTEGKIKKQKLLSVISQKEKSFELPAGWEWTRFGDFALDVSTGPFGSLIHQSDYIDGGIPLVNPSHMIDGRIVPDYSVSLSSEMAKRLSSYYLETGDIVMARRGEVGRVALVAELENGWLCGTGSFVLRFTPEVSRAYICALFRCHSVRSYLAGAAVGTTMVNLNHGILLKMPIAVPPLAEQYRIVTKINLLMHLCNQLKSKLIQAREFNQQLVTTLVEKALTKNVNKTSTNIKLARTLLSAEIVQQLHCEKRMGRVKLQKVLSLAEHIARLKEIRSNEERFAAGPHDPALMAQAVQGLRENKWFEELVLDDGKRYEYRPLAQSGTHRPAYEALWSAEQRHQINELIELMRPWDTAKCERVATLYSAWNDLIIEGREATEAAILQEVLHGWNESKLKYSEAQWRAELAEMRLHSFLIPTGFGKRTSGGKLTLPGFEPSI